MSTADTATPHTPAGRNRIRMRGHISSCGFASGDRFTVGAWDRSPVGPTVDVMWATPEGRRILLVPDELTGRFVTAVYAFDEVRVVPFEHRGDGRGLELQAGPLRLHLRGGRRIPLPPWRPAWVTRRIEAPIARALMGVNTFGVSPTGVAEWYQATGLRWVVEAGASLDDEDLGPMGPIRPRCGFGFTDAPERPSIVAVSPVLEGLPDLDRADLDRADLDGAAGGTAQPADSGWSAHQASNSA